MTLIQTSLATVQVDLPERLAPPIDDSAEEGDVVLELRGVTKAYVRKGGSPLPAVNHGLPQGPALSADAVGSARSISPSCICICSI